MADINQVITLGIGTPSSVKFFITLGLGVGAVTEIKAKDHAGFAIFRDKRATVNRGRGWA